MSNETLRDPSIEDAAAAQKKAEEQKEEQEMLAAYLEGMSPPKEKRECRPEVAEFEQLAQKFEEDFPLEALHAITELTPEEVEKAKKERLKRPAAIALGPILTKLKTLNNETNISPEEAARLQAIYKKLSQAVGIIDKDNKIDHTR